MHRIAHALPLALAACLHLAPGQARAQAPDAPCSRTPGGATMPEAVEHLRRCMEAIAADARRFMASHDAMVGATGAAAPEPEETR